MRQFSKQFPESNHGGGKCILQLRVVRPFLSDKYDITKHPNYRYLSYYDSRNAFNIEQFLSTELKPKPYDVFDVYDINLFGNSEAVE